MADAGCDTPSSRRRAGRNDGGDRLWNGYFALPAARITDPATVYALDTDGSLLSELVDIADQQDIENITPVEGDARSLHQLLPDSVDTVLLANTFHGIDDTAAFVREACGSLRLNGQFVVVNWQARVRAQTTVTGEHGGRRRSCAARPGRPNAP